MMNIINNINFLDKNQIEKCANEIVNLLKKKEDVNENNENNENEEEEDENISIDSSENFSMIKEAFTEIDDCSFYSHYSFEDNNNNNNNNNNDNLINDDNYNFEIEEENENFLNKKRKTI